MWKPKPEFSLWKGVTRHFWGINSISVVTRIFVTSHLDCPQCYWDLCFINISKLWTSRLRYFSRSIFVFYMVYNPGENICINFIYQVLINIHSSSLHQLVWTWISILKCYNVLTTLSLFLSMLTAVHSTFLTHHLPWDTTNLMSDGTKFTSNKSATN